MENKIPAQKEGGFSDAISEIVLETVAEAAFHFQTVKKRFIDINSWEIFAGKEKASFTLCDEEGNSALNPPKIKYYIGIKLPALPNSAGDSFDWVLIECFENEEKSNFEQWYLRVRPSENPKNRNGKIAHFFTDVSTSNFIITRNGKTITAGVHGRNEIPNTDNFKLLEELRNTIVAKGASLLGSNIQWKAFTDGIIKKDEK